MNNYFKKNSPIHISENIFQSNSKRYLLKKNKRVKINYKNGEKYIGEVFNNKKEGFGIYYYSNGNRYEGEWKNDMKEGFGILYYLSGNIYKGEWKNDIQNGYCIYYY